MKRFFAPLVAAGALATFAFAPSAEADNVTFGGFVIRETPGSSTQVADSLSYTSNSMTVVIDEGNEKAGYGTSYFDGMLLSSVIGVSYNRDDLGTGEIYSNIWVTDGTNYATIAPAIGMDSTGNYTGGSDINGLNIQSLGFNIHEFNSPNFDWLVPGAKRVSQALLNADNSVITVADIGHLTVFGNTTFGGGGAAKGGYGFNLVFGDTQNNHVNGNVPYRISGANAYAITVVPTPSAALGGLALMGIAGLRRRKV